jgi:hypothetical protein
MDSQQRRILVVQEAIQQLVSGFDSPNKSNMFEKVEMLQDRWDALSQIMEVQAQRVSVILKLLCQEPLYICFALIYCHVKWRFEIRG